LINFITLIINCSHQNQQIFASYSIHFFFVKYFVVFEKQLKNTRLNIFINVKIAIEDGVLS